MFVIVDPLWNLAGASNTMLSFSGACILGPGQWRRGRPGRAGDGNFLHSLRMRHENFSIFFCSYLLRHLLWNNWKQLGSVRAEKPTPDGVPLLELEQHRSSFWGEGRAGGSYAIRMQHWQHVHTERRTGSSPPLLSGRVSALRDVS